VSEPVRIDAAIAARLAQMTALEFLNETPPEHLRELASLIETNAAFQGDTYEDLIAGVNERARAAALSELRPRPALGAFYGPQRPPDPDMPMRQLAEDPVNLIGVTRELCLYATDDARVARMGLEVGRRLGITEDDAVELVAAGIRQGREARRQHRG
jgi:hypothetical protein